MHCGACSCGWVVVLSAVRARWQHPLNSQSGAALPSHLDPPRSRSSVTPFVRYRYRGEERHGACWCSSCCARFTTSPCRSGVASCRVLTGALQVRGGE
jgi:hypothetical protein